jgi:altronate dehydratase
MTAILVISARDNVGTALEPLAAGRTVHLASGALQIVDDVPRGHKVALRDICAGDPVIKYGSSIGIASARIVAGGHVHTHNLASLRGRGDLAPAVPRSEARIAEPPDTDVPEQFQSPAGSPTSAVGAGKVRE